MLRKFQYRTDQGQYEVEMEALPSGKFRLGVERDGMRGETVYSSIESAMRDVNDRIAALSA